MQMSQATEPEVACRDDRDDYGDRPVIARRASAAFLRRTSPSLTRRAMKSIAEMLHAQLHDSCPEESAVPRA